MTDTPDKEWIERIAVAICRSRGYDPHEIVPQGSLKTVRNLGVPGRSMASVADVITFPRWHKYRVEARAVAIELARELQSSFDQGDTRGTERERERCARIADAYAEVNIEMAGDTLLADPILMGKAHDPAAAEKSHDLQIEGCIASSMFHAAQNIAAAIRLTPTPTEGERG